MNFTEIICRAGLNRKTVRLKLKAKEGGSAETAEFEPYSRSQKGTDVAFFCLDVESCSYLNVNLSSVLEAEMTSRGFKPRFPVTL